MDIQNKNLASSGGPTDVQYAFNFAQIKRGSRKPAARKFDFTCNSMVNHA